MDITKELKNAIAHRIACIERPYINGFAGTGKSRKRDSGDVHSITRKITGSSVFEPFAFRWNFGNGEPAGSSDIYLTVFTALFDIDDDDARRWSSKTEGDLARFEAAGDITRALMRKFTVTKKRFVPGVASSSSSGFGDFSTSHSLSGGRYVHDEE
jgi:hypothetical protein